ncbi:alpha/beta-hydrolase [Mycena albidolilacea]|uniref:Alpha/beta-hydrolase n=1 Tax=Mycena albidolilacea TaxID=1033008 RepID=A0AAD6ZG12_9AGAR|nr:alpha/beta-hydrolase [Mycena albidolilacea]
MDPTRYKQLKTQRGFNYSYYWSPPAPGKPVIFFAHGFPAGSFLWRKQVPFFEPLGYGILVPDFLGYGATDKPTDPKVYIGSGYARDVVEILDAEGIKKVISIGHDWGIYLVSRLINYHPERVAACAFLAGGYGPPVAKGTDRASRYEAMKKMYGYDAFAYMRFFVQPDAPAIIEEHIDSFISLVYPEKVQLWKDHLCVDGGARAYIENNTQSPLPSYMTPEEKEHLKKALLAGGMTAPLCWYRAALEEVTIEDDAQISPEATQVKQPLLFVAFTGDILALPIIGDSIHAQYVKGPVTRKEIGGDHWGAESHAEELNGILLEWIQGLDS